MFPTKYLALVISFPLAALAGEATAPNPGAASRQRVSHSNAAAVAQAPGKPAELPPLPEGVDELKFADFFKLPVGPLGLELSGKVTALDGKRVRILGHMVREQVEEEEGESHKDSATPDIVLGRLMLAPTPQIVNTEHYGLCEDLPPQTLFVTVPDLAGKPVPYTGGLMLLTGTLSVGARTEADGRTSILRLALDSRPAETEKPKNQSNP